MAQDPQARRRDLPDLVTLLAGTGLRIGEASALTWRQIDLAAGSLTVEQTIVRVSGAGLTAKSTKANTGLRVLYVPTRRPTGLRAGLRRRAWWMARPLNTQADLRQAFDAAGYPWVTSHTFRKTVATLMDQAGLSSRATADQLGHANPSLTQDVYYGRRIPDTGAAQVLESAIAADTPEAVVPTGMVYGAAFPP
jgi:integrase